MSEEKKYHKTMDEFIEMSIQNPNKIYKVGKRWVLNGEVHDEEMVKQLEHVLQNPKPYERLLKVINFFRKITFRKPLQ